MGRCKLNMEEKARALTQLQQGVSAMRVAADIGVSRRSIYSLKRAAAALPPGTTPPRKPGTGTHRKTSPRTDNLLRREVLSNPSISAAALKKKYPELLDRVSVRTIQHRLQKDLGLPCRRAAKKPMLTAAMKKKRLAFCHKYKKWTKEQWRKVMFSDESTFRMVRGASNVVRRPRRVSRYEEKYTVKTVKHPDSVMVWGAFDGVYGRGGLYFLPKGQTMNGATYLNVLQEHMQQFYQQRQCDFFMQDGAPCHKTRTVTKWLSDNNMSVLDWPGNSPDLNPIENAWKVIKDKVALKQPGNMKELVDAIKLTWCTQMDVNYFISLSDSMPRRIAHVLKAKGAMTKY